MIFTFLNAGQGKKEEADSIEEKNQEHPKNNL
jgi:hypothetical protein